MAASSADDKLYVDDVFSAWVRTGTGADATITTGIDMTNGYMLWTKGRSGATDHALYHSARGVMSDLASNKTAAQATLATGLKSVSATGYTIGALAKMNTSSATYVDWVFRNADKFYKHAVVTKSGGFDATVSFPGLSVIGMVRVKQTNSAGSWYIWHRSLSAGRLLIGETTAGAATLGQVMVSGETVTLVNGAIANGTYLVEAFAHDEASDGMIQCGLYSGNGSSNTVNLGWEPQFLLIKRQNTTGSWRILDTARGFSVGGNSVVDPSLAANTTNAEDTLQCTVDPISTGFVVYGGGAETNNSASTYIYLAIRRPNKPPTAGTQVYNAVARTGTGVTPVDVNAGLSPDLVSICTRDGGQNITWVTKLNAKENQLFTNANVAELGNHSGITQFLPTGVTLYDAPGTADMNQLGFSYINHFFRRAPGFFDVVCDVGTGAAHTVAHNLTVAPEFVIRKSRSAATQWEVWHSALAATEKLVLSSAAAKATDATAWNSALPGASSFTVGAGTNVNASGGKFVAYLFASLPGISKVGSYTGNGSSQTINCGFSTGARFILIKRTDSTGDWYVWDTARGIVAANDSHLNLNTTAAEVTTNDSVDPDASGFIVNQVDATNVNVTDATYLYLTIA